MQRIQQTGTEEEMTSDLFEWNRPDGKYIAVVCSQNFISNKKKNPS
jgi:hypothetical protein